MRITSAGLVVALLILLGGCGGGGGKQSTVLQSIAVSPANVTLLAEETRQLVATATYSDSTTADVTSSVSWSSSAPGVATITASGGLAKGISTGTSTILATQSGVFGQASIVVEESPAPSDNWTITVFAPGVDSVVPDRFLVAVAAMAPSSEVRSVAVQIDSVSSELRFTGSLDCNGSRQPLVPTACWDKEIDISSLARGAQQLVVTATDILGNSASRTVPIIHDALPVIHVSMPRQHTLARPRLAIAATCSDDDPEGCTSLVAMTCSSPEGSCADPAVTGVSAVDAMIDLGAYDGQRRYLTYVATDSRGQQSRVSVPVYVEIAPRLSDVAQVPGFIMDADASRILYVDDAAGAMRIYDRTASIDTLVSSGPLEINHDAFLTPAGAIYAVGSGSSNRTLVSMESGAFIDLGPLSPGTLLAKGRFAVWQNGLTILLRDVISKSVVTVSTGTLAPADLAADGTVTFANDTNQIALYRAGNTTVLTSTGYNAYPRTNGTDVVYVDLALGSRIVLSRGGSSIELSPITYSGYSPGVDYQIAGDWLAFIRVGSASTRQVWRMNPQNQTTQLTFLNSNSQLELLGENGAVTFINSGRRYFATAASAAYADVGSSSHGRTLFIDGVPHVIIGGALLAIQQ